MDTGSLQRLDKFLRIAVISPFPLHRIPHFFPGRKAAFKHHYLRRNLL
jgi:hypothetical protein